MIRKKISTVTNEDDNDQLNKIDDSLALSSPQATAAAITTSSITLTRKRPASVIPSSDVLAKKKRDIKK